MSNNYFEIKKTVEYPEVAGYKGYRNDYELTLTAFVGGESGNHTQLTLQTNSTISMQVGTAYIVLDDEDVDLLIAGLLERKLKKITATGEEKSIFSPPKEE